MRKIEGYTKGPWQVSEERCEHTCCFTTAVISGDDRICECDDENAELIAAAPETYERCVAYEEALREMMAAIPKEPPTDMAEALRWHERQVEAGVKDLGILLENGVAVVSPLRRGKGCVVQFPTHGE